MLGRLWIWLKYQVRGPDVQVEELQMARITCMLSRDESEQSVYDEKGKI